MVPLFKSDALTRIIKEADDGQFFIFCKRDNLYEAEFSSGDNSELVFTGIHENPVKAIENLFWTMDRYTS